MTTGTSEIPKWDSNYTDLSYEGFWFPFEVTLKQMTEKFMKYLPNIVTEEMIKEKYDLFSKEETGIHLLAKILTKLFTKEQILILLYSGDRE